MTQTIPPAAAEYVRAVNAGDAAGLRALFTATAVVDDVGGEHRGAAAIGHWAEKEIFGVNVSLKVIDTTTTGGAAVLTTIVDGDFDRTGLPNPLVMTQTIVCAGEKIERLTCRLATAPQRS